MMLKRLLPAFLMVSVLVAASAAQGTEKITLEQTMRGGGIYKRSLESWKWSADGTLLKKGTKYFDPMSGEERPEPPPAEKKPEDKAKPANGKKRAAAPAGAKLSNASADGRFVSYVKEKNLYVRDVESGAENAVSTDGSAELLYGELDWVYQEEVYGRGDFNAQWWSTDSKRLAYLRTDESGVHEFAVVDHIPNRGVVENTNYPKSGDANPIATLWVYDPESKKSVAVDISKYKDSEPLIVYVGWTPKGDKVVYQIQDRIQTWLDLNEADPATGVSKTLIHETSDTWVNRIEMPIWQKDGTFFWWSERTGYQHLYHYKADGTLIRPITKGEFEVGSILKHDEEKGLIYYQAKEHSAVAPHFYRVPVAGGERVHLTPERGSHQIELNHDGSLLIDTFSSVEQPGKIVLRSADGKAIRTLSEATFSTTAGFSKPELVEIPARDGFKMDAIVLKPHGFDAAKKYPVFITTYSGPNAPTVRDSWQASPWPQFLAQEGIIVFQVNNRSSSGKGQKWTGACYKQFGVTELQDFEDAIDWLAKNPWVDASKVGITGWSYGGYMTAYALTHSKKFALGLAGAGVYDWHLYDTIYTERYMSTPALNPEGYKVSSVVEAAKNLHGHLQIVHGSMDDNVHMQNAMQLAYQLQLADKDFEMMIYPKSRHGLGSAKQNEHNRRLNWKAIEKHLLGR